jgi:hypothetical protein
MSSSLSRTIRHKSWNEISKKNKRSSIKKSKMSSTKLCILDHAKTFIRRKGKDEE